MSEAKKIEERVKALQQLPHEEFKRQTKEAIARLRKIRKKIGKMGINVDPHTTYAFCLCNKTIRILKEIRQNDAEALAEVLKNIDFIMSAYRQMLFSLL